MNDTTLKVLEAVCVIQREEDIGDESTYENGDGSYLLLAGQTLYNVSKTGRIAVTKIRFWDSMEVVTK